jgi:RNA polymerase sigma-70 factor (ECF subfamily)
VIKHDVAEDIAMITWQTIWERKDSFKSDDNVKAFLYIAAKNLAYTYLKGQKVRHNIESLIPFDETTASDLISIENKEFINAAITAIKERFNEKYVYIFKCTMLGFTNKEIGRQLGINGSTVTSVRSIIMKFLATKFGNS